MKILFINRQEKKGGAAIAAMRLAEGLKNYYNAEIFFIVEHKQSNNENVFECKKNFIIRLIERIINKITSLLGLQYIWFPFSSKRILELTKRIQPDVISLHNIHGGYFDTALLKKLSLTAPIIWTLHDMWPILSSATHTKDENWKQMIPGKIEKKHYPPIFFEWGNMLMKRKKKIYNDSNLTLITPSKWLLKNIKMSSITDSLISKKIYNFTDNQIFNPSNSNIKIKEYCFNLLYSCTDDKDPIKGADLIQKILKILDKKLQVEISITIFGSSFLSDFLFNKIHVYNVKYIKSDHYLNDLYNQHSCYLQSSRFDTAPLTLQEATMCGLPCMTFDVGGCGEIIKDNYNGFVIPPFDKEHYAHQLLRLINDKQLQQTFKENALKQSQKLFSKENTLDNYYKLFKQAVN